jgi:hypothetical protein
MEARTGRRARQAIISAYDHRWLQFATRDDIVKSIPGVSDD